MSITSLKKQVLDEILRIIRHLDHTGKNTEYYKNFIGKMSEKEFSRWFRNFLEDKDENLYLEFTADDEPSIEDIRKSAKTAGIPLEHRVYYRHGAFQDAPTSTREPVMLGVITTKMLQQTTPLKVKRGDDVGNRSVRTGQVTGSSRVVNLSEPERNALLAVGAKSVIKELSGPRADAQNAKSEMYQRIANGESISLDDLTDDPADKTASVTFHVYMLGGCIETDIIDTGMLLKQTRDSELNKALQGARVLESDASWSEHESWMQNILEEVDTIDRALDVLPEDLDARAQTEIDQVRDIADLIVSTISQGE